MSATLRWTWPMRVPGSIGVAAALRSSAWRSCTILPPPVVSDHMGIGRWCSQAGLTRVSLPPTNRASQEIQEVAFMADTGLAKTIDDAFERRNDIGPSTQGPVRQAVEAALDLLDRGEARVA